MLKRDGFQPSDPAPLQTQPCLRFLPLCLVRLGLLLPGSTLSRPSAGRACWPIPLSPVPESQKRDLTVAPGSSSGLFDSELLSEVVAQVHGSSQISSNLALLSISLQGRSTPSSSSSSSSSHWSSFAFFARGRPSGKRSSSSSRAGSRKRFWAFGFLEVGAITFPEPFRRLSVPPLQPGGTGSAEPWW